MWRALRLSFPAVLRRPGGRRAITTSAFLASGLEQCARLLERGSITDEQQFVTDLELHRRVRGVGHRAGADHRYHRRAGFLPQLERRRALAHRGYAVLHHDRLEADALA